MPWLICAVLIWLAIFIVIRFNVLLKLWGAVFWSVLLCYGLHSFFLSNNFYRFQETFDIYQGIPILYLVAVGGLAVFLIHFLPEEKGWQFLYFILFSGILTMLEFFALLYGLVIHVQWSLLNSFLFTFAAVIVVTWLGKLLIKEQKGYHF